MRCEAYAHGIRINRIYATAHCPSHRDSHTTLYIDVHVARQRIRLGICALIQCGMSR